MTATGDRERQKIRTFLWSDDCAEEAARFYTSIFKDAVIVDISRRGEGADAAASSVTFRLHGREFVAFNGGPHFTFTPAISLFVDCADQAEVDELWERLVAGGEPSRCGWLRDKFGLSWQIVPRRLIELLDDDDEAKSSAVMHAMLGMEKIDIAGLQRAYDGA